MATRIIRIIRRPPPSSADSIQMQPMTSREASSDEPYEFYEQTIDVLKRHLPWVLAAGFFALALLGILTALVFVNGLNDEATPTTTPKLTTTYKTLAGVGKSFL